MVFSKLRNVRVDCCRFVPECIFCARSMTASASGDRSDLTCGGARMANAEVPFHDSVHLMSAPLIRNYLPVHQSYPPTHTHTHPLSTLMSRKGYLRKQGTGLRRCVYTDPYEHTTSNTGLRASDEDQRNTHTHLRSPEKLVRTYVYVEVASNRN